MTPSSVRVPLLGVPPLSDPFLDHSLTPSSCILQGNTVICFPAADLLSPFQRSINHQVDALRRIRPPSSGVLCREWENTLVTESCSVGTVSSVSRVEIPSAGWSIFLFYIFWRPSVYTALISMLCKGKKHAWAITTLHLLGLGIFHI